MTIIAGLASGWLALAALLSLGPVAGRDAEADPSPASDPARPVEVMILGTYHFANPGQDMVNPEVDDMLAPRRQREIAQLVESLAAWQPTKIAVENEAPPPGLTIESYARARDLLETSRSETVQIGYRLALMLGHEAVFGHDERGGGQGEPDYFPFGKVQAFAERSGQAGIIEAMMAEVEAQVAREDAERGRISVARSLFAHNDGAALAARHDRLHYPLLAIGNGDEQPGAELNAYWYMRNAKMFAKIDMIAEPGDRVLVIAGSGHAPWLRHFVEHTPGYALVEAMPYLRAAAARAQGAPD
ncbi:MAG: DUF5694 domain-containing protein [Erythrobacter sp.]|jgi:hypothetical protein|nr:DUF5694 domain-containing protein [Erythrobacter sp.]